MSARLSWLPVDNEWRNRLKALRRHDVANSETWSELVSVANTRLDFIGTNALDETARRIFASGLPPDLATVSFRLAILGSSTMAHLHASIRVAGIRRGLWIETYECEYGQYLQELLDPASALYRFTPRMTLVALDAHHLARGIHAGLNAEEVDLLYEEACDRLRQTWSLAREAFGGSVIQQTLLPVHPLILGCNEHRLPGSKAGFISRLNGFLRPASDTAGIDLLALDERVSRDGLDAWHDQGLWHRAKQEITPAAAPLYGDLVIRLAAARLGRSSKCLVMDLDNTIWGGVIGDDGMDGIVLGQGSPLGEAFVTMQDYAREQSRRGIILAICSKNDEVNAVEPFNSHPDMLLKRDDIASFMSNWQDKASNIRAIANALSIGLDSIVFVDDNPFERNLVRCELPVVSVPELPEDPALYVSCLADAGYFDNVGVTLEDRSRSGQYQGNIRRDVLRSISTDLPSYLRGLEMVLSWQTFDDVNLQRSVQLINKTNQFNLTTRRVTESDILAVIEDPYSLGLQLRLTDRFGDNGIIAVVIGRMRPPRLPKMLIETWLMSCRVLGRQVEQATMLILLQQAREMGVTHLIGEYRPTKKNAMVASHYEQLGFTTIGINPDGQTHYELDLASYAQPDLCITIKAG